VAREFVGRTTPEILDEIKRSLGPDALIVSATDRRGAGRDGREERLVGITACRSGEVGGAARRGRTGAHAADAGGETAAAPGDLRTRLVGQGVSEELARALCEDVARVLSTSGRDGAEAIDEALVEAVAARCPAPATVHLPADRVRRVAVVGPSGAGKTAAIVTLAASLVDRTGAIRVGAFETGAAGLERLGVLSEVFHLPIETIARPRDWKSLGAGLRAGVLLLDTPGVGAGSAERVARLKTFLAEAGIDETHVVLPATLDPDEGTHLLDEFRDASGARLLVTKVDEAASVGRVLNRILGERRVASYISVGRRAHEDLLPAGPEALRALARRLLDDAARAGGRERRARA